MAFLSEKNSISRRVTLAVVCLATAMLMLDIAVVNNPPSRASPATLHTGLSGLQWVIDAYTLALATIVLSAGSLAEPPRTPPRVPFRPRRVHYLVAGMRAFGQHRDARRRSCRAGIRRRRHVRGVARPPGARLSGHARACWCTRRLTARRSAPRSPSAPLVGGLLTSGLSWRWIFLVNIPIGIIAIAATLARVEESRDPLARKIDWLGQFLLGGGLFLLVLALLRGNDQGWGSTAIIAQLSGAAVLLALFANIEAARQGADAAVAVLPQPRLRGHPGRHRRDLGVVLRRVPLHDALPPERARALRDPDRPGLHARHGADVLRVKARAPSSARRCRRG